MPSPGRAGGALVFVGFMGAGKTTAARAVAAALGVEPLDSDRELEAELGETIEDFFDRAGEEEFRRREEDLVLRLLARDDARVVALGGGAPTSERVREALREHLVVHLEVRASDAWRRVSSRGRPLARDRRRFDELHAERRDLYEGLARATVPPGGRDAVRAVAPALAGLRDAPAGTRLLWARSASGDYPVFLGPGLIREGFFFPAGPRRFVVTDSGVEPHHRVDAEATELMPAGESEKTLARAEAVLRALARAGMTRDDLLVAVGGGVVGDLAGFCAAVYQRGVPWAGVPTTLVAQVDSAYGGKTGADLPEAKNYVGAFHQPSAVLVDPDALATLPAEEWAAGYAEVVKTALIAGGGLWSRVRAGEPVDLEIIAGCVRTKLEVVAEDERDEGRRQVLNLGHTVGHAIEAATGYTRVRHGEGVALGLLCALRLSGHDALRDEVGALLAAKNLPTELAGADPDAVAELVARDKKRRNGRVPFVLVESPGAVTPGHTLEADAVRAAIGEVCFR